MLAGADTDASPYDFRFLRIQYSLYITGKAVEICAQRYRGKICQLGARLLEYGTDQVVFDGREVRDTVSDKAVSLFDIAASMVNNDIALEETVEQGTVYCPRRRLWPVWPR